MEAPPATDSRAPTPLVRIGIDTGGTFTDIACTVDGTLAYTLKVPSTPADPGLAVLEALRRLLDAAQIRPEFVVTLAHGTTVATNAVIERKGARVGLLATEGFRDVLEIGRQMRQEMYSVRLEPQTPVFLAPGRMRRGIRERVGAHGEIVTPLDEGAAALALDELAALGAESIAICLLFSFLNPAHELRLRELVAQRHPGLDVSLSTEVDPAFREYERTAVTAFDAYIKPVVGRYLGRLGERLRLLGVRAPLQVMQSRGGLANAETARRRPVRLFLSGPAAGVIGGQSEGALVGAHELITVDVGGTSCDIALVSAAKPLTRTEGQIDGYPVRVPMVDVNAIGAGGGSIAWIDGAGGLRVGPHSAGSEPGPACYGRGGVEATVTDASVVLGYLDPDYFAGGTFALDPALAERAIRTRVAEPLGLALEAAAAGIHAVLNAQMAEGIRLASIGRGYDPREFALVPLGGAGPLHGCALAEELGISRIIVPRHPGVLSAGGLLAAPIEHEASVAFGQPLERLEITTVLEALGSLDARCSDLMRAEGELTGNVETSYFADVCYTGQAYHLEVPLRLEAEPPLDALYADFLTSHERIYGHAVDGPARIVNLRAVHSVPALKGGGRAPPPPREPVAGLAATAREVYVARLGRRVPASIRHRESLRAGEAFPGPAIVEQDDTTILLAPGWQATVDATGVLELNRVGPQEQTRA